MTSPFDGDWWLSYTLMVVNDASWNLSEHYGQTLCRLAFFVSLWLSWPQNGYREVLRCKLIFCLSLPSVKLAADWLSRKYIVTSWDNFGPPPPPALRCFGPKTCNRCNCIILREALAKIAPETLKKSWKFVIIGLKATLKKRPKKSLLLVGCQFVRTAQRLFHVTSRQNLVSKTTVFNHS